MRYIRGQTDRVVKVSKSAPKSAVAPLEVASKLREAVSSLNLRRVAELYADNATVWHNTTQSRQSKAESLAFLAQLFGLFQSFELANPVCRQLPGGFLQYHTVRAIFKDGTPAPEVPACMVADVEDGVIIELREWFDSNQFSEVFARLAKQGVTLS